MASCILHIGTHKTGTTTLQNAFASGAEWLDAAGLYYPAAGRIYGGHHHLVPEMLGLPHAGDQGGSLAGLLAEIAGKPDRISIVSSERLHALAARPAALRALAKALASHGIATRVVLYVRERPSYLESLYAQLLKHGLRSTFREFVEAVALDGRFEFDDIRLYDVKYARIADAFSEAFGASTIAVRPYAFDTTPDAIVRDFLGVTGFGHASVPDSIERANVTLSFREIARRWLGNLPHGAAAPERLEAVARGLFGDRADAVLDGPFRVFDEDEAAALTARFAEDDRALERTYGVRLPAPHRPRGLGAMRLFDALMR